MHLPGQALSQPSESLTATRMLASWRPARFLFHRLLFRLLALLGRRHVQDDGQIKRPNTDYHFHACSSLLLCPVHFLIRCPFYFLDR